MGEGCPCLPGACLPALCLPARLPCACLPACLVPACLPGAWCLPACLPGGGAPPANDPGLLDESTGTWPAARVVVLVYIRLSKVTVYESNDTCGWGQVGQQVSQGGII